jgi:hypothetical protein
MGAGRRTQTFTFNDNNDKGGTSPYSPGSGGGHFRALKKSDLAGVIFGCSHQTFKECVTQLIFGILFCPSLFLVLLAIDSENGYVLVVS